MTEIKLLAVVTSLSIYRYDMVDANHCKTLEIFVWFNYFLFYLFFMPRTVSTSYTFNDRIISSTATLITVYLSFPRLTLTLPPVGGIYFGNCISAKHRDPAPTWSKVIRRKSSDKSSADKYLRCWMNLASSTVLTENPKFMNLGLLSVPKLDELGSVFIPTTRIRCPT